MHKLLLAIILFSNFVLSEECKEASEITLTQEQEKQYLASLTNRNVVFIRSTLNRYLSKETAHNFDIENFKKLDAYDRMKYEGRFILFGYTNSVGNTAVIEILFQENPDGIYEAIVADGNKLLSWEFKPYSECSSKNMKIAYKKFISDKTYGL